jgi:hypothetical protein
MRLPSGRRVVAGPVEAMARDLIAATAHTKTCEPKDAAAQY